MAICEATTAIESGREGRMPCSFATSAITGKRGKCRVTGSGQKRHESR